MDKPNTTSTIHAQDAMVRIATNETSNTQDRPASNIVNTDEQDTKHEIESDVKDVKTQPPEPATSTSEKIKLQDQTNLLPLKQLLIVFAGLSCALFCESTLPRLKES